MAAATAAMDHVAAPPPLSQRMLCRPDRDAHVVDVRRGRQVGHGHGDPTPLGVPAQPDNDVQLPRRQRVRVEPHGQGTVAVGAREGSRPDGTCGGLPYRAERHRDGDGASAPEDLRERCACR